MNPAAFHDHFSAVAAEYAGARPEYPEALFDWIASIAPSSDHVWEAGCGSGQASRSLATRFAYVDATDPSGDQIEHAHGPSNIVFSVESAERCSLPDASVDAVCVAQALHWFDRDRFFAQCKRALKPGGVLVTWGYQDIEVPEALAAANAALQDRIRDYWPPQRADIDTAYAGYRWPFQAIDTPHFKLCADWPLARLQGYFSSYSASKRCREATGQDPVALHEAALTAAWGDPDVVRPVCWPLFVRACRKSS